MNKENHVNGLSLRNLSRILMICTFVVTVFLVASLFLLTSSYRKVEKSNKELLTLVSSANDLEYASDLLTEQVRYYVATKEEKYYRAYFKEVNETKSRERALATIKESVDDSDAVSNLESSLNESIELMNTEYYAFRLVIETSGFDINEYTEVKDVVLTDDDKALSADEAQKKAIDLVFSAEYNGSKDRIEAGVTNCIDKLFELSDATLSTSNNRLVAIMVLQQLMISLLVIFLVIDFVVIYYKLVLPLDHSIEAIIQGHDLKVEGVKEFKTLSKVYNDTKQINETNKDRLTYEVEHDKLTGLYNRNGYDSLFHRLNLENTAYVLIDIDNFKKINDRYGHAIGDKVLRKVGNVLRKYFRSDDYLCRIGGDEFAVLLSDCSKDIADQLKEKGNKINVVLQTKEGELPPVSLSIGVAFGDEHDDTDSLFKKADKALYETKNTGRNGVTVFSSNPNEN